MRFDVIKPMEQQRTTYEGNAVYLTDPEQMADPSSAFRNNPHKRVKVDLLHEASGPVYGSSGNHNEQSDNPEKQFAKAHYEQHMRVTGTVDVEGDVVEIDPSRDVKDLTARSGCSVVLTFLAGLYNRRDQQPDR